MGGGGCCRSFCFLRLGGWVGGWVGGVVFFFFWFPSQLGGWVVGVLCFRFWSRSLVGVVVAPVCRWWSGGCCRAVLLAAWCGLLCCCAVLLLPFRCRVVVVPGVRRLRCCCCCCCCCRCRCCCCCLPFCCCCCCWCCRSSSASPSCGGRLPPRHDFSAGPCQATSSLPLGLPPPPNFDNIVLTHPVSPNLGVWAIGVLCSVMQRSRHGPAHPSPYRSLRAAMAMVSSFFFFLFAAPF